MTSSVYFVGAGFTKALERSAPVPMMWDFVRVMAHYARTDDVVLMALIGLEAMGCYSAKNQLLERLASSHQPKQHRQRLLWHIRRRAAESIEDLLCAAEKIEATIQPMTPAALNAAIYDPVARTQYAINRVFRSIGWNLKLGPVTALLARRLRRDTHTFVSFNYDLVLERALETAAVGWCADGGYGVNLRHRIDQDPANPPGPTLLPARRARQRVTVLKPHGSLNWLLSQEGIYRLPFLAASVQREVRYIGTRLTHAYVRPRNRLPIRVAPLIVPPTSNKNTDLPVLRQVRELEASALETAAEVFVLGWSMPKTDRDQTALIRKAVSRRGGGFSRVVAVNYHAGDGYYRRVARMFGISMSRLECFDGGVLDFAGRELRSLQGKSSP